jgi:ketosteroid isomerase-like protein
VGEEGNRGTVEKFFQALDTRDWDGLATLLDTQYVWEMPQSGERVRGLDNNRAMNESYPGLPKVETRRITGTEDKWVLTPNWTVLKVTGSGDDFTAESLVNYPDGSVWHSVDIFRFRGGKILHQTSYFAAQLEASEWRSTWVERI